MNTRQKFFVEFAHYALAAMCALPFLMPFHTMPIGSFYDEWLALLLGLLTIPAILIAAPQRLPRITLLPLALAALILLQKLILKPAYGEPATLAILYLLWSAVVIISASALSAIKGRAAVIQRLACWLLAAALINSFCVLLFASGFIGQNFPLRASPPGNIFLAQANHLAHFLWLGVASALYLFHAKRTPTWLLALLVLPLLLASALTTSRASLPYAAWLIALSWLCDSRRTRLPAIVIACVYLALLLSLPNLGIGDGNNAISRIASDVVAEKVHGSSIRLALINAGWLAFLDHPLLGAGFGSYSWAVFQHVDTVSGWQGTAEHAHQLFVNLLAELGIIAPLILLVGLLDWGRNLWRQRKLGELYWIAAIAGIGFAHAQVEYPFWYAYFLGLFALTLGLAEQRTVSVRTPRLFWWLTPCFGLLILASNLRDYVLIERWIYIEVNRPANAKQPEQYFARLLEAGKGSLLRPWVDSRIAAAMSASPDQLNNKLALCDNLLPFSVSTPAVFTCSLLYVRAGREAEAQAIWRRGEKVFAEEADQYRKLVITSLPTADTEFFRQALPQSSATAAPH